MDSQGRMSYPANIPEQQGYANRDNETKEITNSSSSQSKTTSNTTSDFNYDPRMDVSVLFVPSLITGDYELREAYSNYYDSQAFKHFINAASYGWELHDLIVKDDIDISLCQQLATKTIEEARNFIHSHVSFDTDNISTRYKLEDFHDDQVYTMESFIEAAEDVQTLLDRLRLDPDGYVDFEKPDYIFIDTLDGMVKCMNLVTGNDYEGKRTSPGFYY